MQRRDWNLLVLTTAGGEALTPVQLQKVLFLIGKNLPEEVSSGFYDFKPYDYGPFDATVYQDAEELEREKKAYIRSVPGRRWSEYGATPAGVEAAKQIKSELDPRILDYVDRLVEWARSLSFQNLLRAIYKAHPKYKVNSVFQN